jgi:geranylgeranylglycerol-phosphate geranylgeranyltransferase
MLIASKLKAYLLLIRPYGPVIMGFTVVLGEYLAISCVPAIHELYLGFLTAFFLTSAAFVLNDYMDIEIDRINSPNKPLPKGILSKDSALIYWILLSTLALFFPLFLSIYVFFFAFFSFIISILYNVYGKKTGFLGNLMVSFCMAISIIFGAFIVDRSINQVSLVIFFLIFLSNTGREITKGIADAEGDKRKNVKSVVLLVGAKKAAIIAAIFYCLTTITGPIFYHSFDISNPLILIPAIVGEIGFIFSAYKLLRTPSREVASQVNRQINIWMVLLLVVLFLGNL